MTKFIFMALFYKFNADNSPATGFTQHTFKQDSHFMEIKKIKWPSNYWRQYLSCVLAIFTASNTAYADWDTKRDTRIDIPISVSAAYPQGSKTEDYRNQMGQLTTNSSINPEERCDNNLPYNTGLSSDGKVRGLVIDNDIILTFSGSTEATVGTPNYYSSWKAVDGNVILDRGNYPANGTLGFGSAASSLVCIGTLGYWKATNSKSSFNGKITIYVGPNAPSGKFKIPDLYYNLIASSKQKIFTGGQLTVSSMVCSVSTDNIITFPPVEGTKSNGQLLETVVSKVDINCKDATSSDTKSVDIKFTRQGTGRYTNSANILRTTDSVPLAEIRGYLNESTTNSRCGAPPGINLNGAQKQTVSLSSWNTSIPLVWSLCSIGANALGVGSAAVNMEVTWL
nr:hypothetical protein [uncultured Moellerella sp.]